MRGTILLPVLLFVPGLWAQAPAKTLNELKAFYATNGAKSHGPDGSAHGADGKNLGGLDFTDAKETANETANATDAERVKTIRKGLFFGIRMPSFKDQLSEADALLLVQGIVRKAEKGKVITPEEGAAR